MVNVVLFDLDDTLLMNDMTTFLPAYFERLARYSARQFEPTRVIEAVRASTMAMIGNDDPQLSNQQVFWQHFEAQLGESRSMLEPFFSEFYALEFPHLESLTAPVPGAAEVVEWFRTKGCRLVLATNPVFPAAAIEQRVRWAGLECAMFDLITSYENMHATKPSVYYYHEILSVMGCQASQALMVGNDWCNDIVPARRLGLKTFYVAAETEQHALGECGSLERWYETLTISGCL